MKRQVPILLLKLLEGWLPFCCTCIRWSSGFSVFFRLGVGVRQCSSLAPVLFSIYVNDVVSDSEVANLGYIFAFADDILLVSLSVVSLQSMLDTVEKRLNALNLYINASKSHCLRIGPRYRVECATLTTNDMDQLAWSPQVRYLGVWISSS